MGVAGARHRKAASIKTFPAPPSHTQLRPPSYIRNHASVAATTQLAQFVLTRSPGGPPRSITVRRVRKTKPNLSWRNMAATNEQLDGLRNTFKAADKDGSGKLDLGEMQNLVMAMPGMKKEYAEMIMKPADLDKDMMINYEELVNMFQADDPEDKAKAISRKERAKLMSIGEAHIGSGMMGLVWSMADEDGNGKLDYEEFCKLLNKYKMK